jgi:hypothetical protein
MARVFLSYSREDRSLVQPLAAAIEEAGHELWWDRKITGGAEYSGEIEAALERAEAVVVVWSRASTRSAWVRDEAAFARDQGKLVPVTIDDAGPPLGFRQIHALDLRGWNADPQASALDDLLHSLAVRSGLDERPDAARPPVRGDLSRSRIEPFQEPVAKRRRRAGWAIGLLLAALTFAKCVSDGDVAFEPGNKGHIVIERPDGGRVDFSQDENTGEFQVKPSDPVVPPPPPPPPIPRPTDKPRSGDQPPQASR